ncbi:MAG TPA: AraC family transcriptional regulator [Chitinophagaceae bacterium]
MKIPEVKFIDSGSASTFEQLCFELNSTSKNDVLILNNNTWKGVIKKIEVETGLYLHFWNCSLATPLLIKHDAVDPSVPLAYNIIYSLTPGIFSFKQGPLLQNFTIRSSTDTFCTTNATKADFELAPHNNLRVLFISITGQWMQQHFGNADNDIADFIASLQTDLKPLFIFETSDKDEYLLANEIADHIQHNPVNHLLVHSRLLLLISQFFDKLLVHNQQEKDERVRQYFDKLKMTESIISDHLSGKLPSVKEISDRVEMNETALKKYFKLVYGKNIYEYYLEKKMDQAKRMLIEKNLNVNEVAESLGYEKTTNFIEIFKKHFGYLPGSIRKNPL